MILDIFSELQRARTPASPPSPEFEGQVFRDAIEQARLADELGFGCWWTVEHHGAFQMVYYAHHYGWDPEERQEYKDSPYYQSCVDFCERWDQASFDPDYAQDSLESFEGAVREVFARKAYDPDVQQKGVVTGLPPL